ncbi:MAG: hypothetical protein FWE21_10615 [Defluviitaleaceae bacterium]|nr:hypothetical protein [Defluviitaleaceae bacterium]
MIDYSGCLEYKGFFGSVNYCMTDKILYGKILGHPHLLAMYHGDTLESFVADFHEAVDFHIESEEWVEEAAKPEHELATT